MGIVDSLNFMFSSSLISTSIFIIFLCTFVRFICCSFSDIIFKVIDFQLFAYLMNAFKAARFILSVELAAEHTF